jgi:hypothetical protein
MTRNDQGVHPKIVGLSTDIFCCDVAMEHRAKWATSILGWVKTMINDYCWYHIYPLVK